MMGGGEKECKGEVGGRVAERQGRSGILNEGRGRY